MDIFELIAINPGRRTFAAIILAVVLMASGPKGLCQVLTLNRSECVQVEVRFDEMVPHHKYREFLDMALMMEEHDIWDPDEDRTKPDTSAMRIKDDFTVFFVWQKDAVMRIVARKEANTAYILKADPNISLPVVSLTGRSQEQAGRQLLQLQRMLARPFLHYQPDKTYWNINGITAKTPLNMDVFDSGRLVGESPRIHLLLKGKAQPETWYRILFIAGFGQSLEPTGAQNYRTELEPVFSFEDHRAGFYNEIPKVNQERADGWVAAMVKKIKGLFSDAGRSNYDPWEWLSKLTLIYENIFSVTWNNSYTPAPFDGNRSLPYFGYQEFRNWPWDQNFFVFPENKWQFQPVYLGNSVAGYRVSNREMLTETQGFLVVPGKFFLPNRLKIISVNGIAWEHYQPPVLTQVPEILPPSFPGGASAQRTFMNKILTGSHFSVGGFTTLAFDVDAAGKATYVPQHNPVYTAADSFGIIIATNRSRWLPGLQNGRPVFSRIRIAFPVVLPRNQRDYTDLIQRVTRAPEFPGGPYALEDYLKKNIRYPASARRQKNEGFVLVKVTITENGNIHSTEILKGLTADLDTEAIRLIKSMPKWYPGKQDGNPVQSDFTLPVQFNLEASAASK